MATRSSTPKIGLALAGGGPEGAIYEIGALRALDEAIEGLDFDRIEVLVGVSAGAFIAANVANRLSTRQMCRAIVKTEPGEHPFIPENFFRPALGEVAERGSLVPKLLLDGLRESLRRPGDPGVVAALMRLGRALPVGVFDNEPIRSYLSTIYSIKGRTDDFRELSRQLFVVSSDLETGRAVRFGEPGLDHVPISKAVQASTALPGLYPPVEIGGHSYVDGVLLKTLHASVALEQGVDLLLCVNPIVPVDLSNGDRGVHHHGYLVDRGLPTVLSQTFRTLIRSRLRAGMAVYADRFPGQDVVLFEPRRDDYRMFFTNIFTFSSRKAVCEHAYRATRRQLLNRREELAPILDRHGLRLDLECLRDDSQSIWQRVGLPASGDVADLPRDTLDRLDGSLARLEHLLTKVAGLASDPEDPDHLGDSGR